MGNRLPATRISRRAPPLGTVLGTLALATVLAAGLACSRASRIPGVYRIDIQQGNVIDDDALARLEPGMPKRKVQFLIGTPAINDTFHEDRWDYVYTYKPGWGKARQRRVSLFFEDGKLARVEGDVKTQLGEAAGEIRERERVVDVPPDRNRGLFRRLRRSFASTEESGSAEDRAAGGAGASEEAAQRQASPATEAASTDESDTVASPTAEESANKEAAADEGEKKSLFRRLADRFRIFGGTETEEAVPAQDPDQEPSR